jgi:hypothetical protein
MGPAGGFEVMFEAIINQGAEAGVSLQEHIAAPATIATVRAAFGYMGFAAKRHTASPAVASLDMDMDLIDEHLMPAPDLQMSPLLAAARQRAHSW